MARKHVRTILVTGATGHQGGAAVRRLRDKGFAIRALTRDPDSARARALVGHGTEVVRGDLDDPDSLRRAMDGADGVYSVQAVAAEDAEVEVRQGVQLLEAAMRAGVKQLVYRSVAAADRKTGIPHFESKQRIEERIRASGIQYTILRPVFFMENWLGMRDLINQGTLAFPLRPETNLEMISADDIGGFAAMAFEHPGRWQGRTLEIAADSLPMTGIAAAFSRMAGREVQYRQLPWDDYEKRFGHELRLMFQWIDANGFGIDIAAVRQENPNMMGFERWLQSNWAKAQTA